MKNLNIKIGNTTLKNPLICGSGEHFIKPSGIQKALDAGAGAVVIKSVNESPAAKEQLDKTDYTLLNSDFERLPWNFEPPRDASLFNRSGLFPGSFNGWLKTATIMDHYAKEKDAYCIASLIPASIEKLIEHAQAVEKAGIRIIEVNVGAPHGEEAAKGTILLEREAEHIKEITAKLREAVSIPLWIKLTGQSSEIPKLVNAAKEADADAVTLMGRYMAFIPDIETQSPILGTHAAYGGPWALPLTCHWLVKSRSLIGSDYPLLGTNGARDGHDIIRLMLSGAAAVQMTSAIFTGGYDVIEKSIKQIENYLSEKNMTASELIGLAANKVKTYSEQPNNEDYWREFVPD